MKQITDEQFEKALNAVSESIKKLMYNSKIYDSAKELLQNQTDTININKTVLPIGYNLLGLLSDNEAGNILEELGVKNSSIFLVEIKEKVLKEVSPKAKDTQFGGTDMNSEITEAEKALENLPKVRTMRSDMQALEQNDIPTYTSTQEVLLNEDRKKQDNTPRWGS